MRIGRFAAVTFVLAVGSGCLASFETPEQPGPGAGPSGGGAPGGDDAAGGGDPAAPAPAPEQVPPSYSVALDRDVATLGLGETQTFTLTLTSENGFAGPVALSALGLPASWQASFTPASTVELAAGGTAVATLALSVPTDGEAASSALDVTAEGGGLTDAAPLSIDVRPEVVIRIPRNALSAPALSFGGTVRVRYVAPGTRITWINDDSIDHRIHGNGDGGLTHEPNNLQPGASYSVTIDTPGTYDYECHIHGSMSGTLVVTDAP